MQKKSPFWMVLIGASVVGLCLTACGPDLASLEDEPSQQLATYEQTISLGTDIIAIAVAENGRSLSQVGQERTSYPYALGKYLDANEPWCSEFVAWVYKIAGNPFTGGSEGGWMLSSTTQLKSWFTSRSRFVLRGTSEFNNYTPQPGDYIRYNNSSGGHSGIVRSVSGTTLYTVEGNVSSKVAMRTQSNWRNITSIDGFGKLSTSETTPEEKKDAGIAIRDLGGKRDTGIKRDTGAAKVDAQTPSAKSDSGVSGNTNPSANSDAGVATGGGSDQTGANNGTGANGGSSEDEQIPGDDDPAENPGIGLQTEMLAGTCSMSGPTENSTLAGILLLLLGIFIKKKKGTVSSMSSHPDITPDKT